MEDLRKRQLISGSVLIVIGIVMYFVLKAQEHISYSALLALAGAGFVGAYFYFRNYGYVIPGCILLGLGVGRMWGETAFSFGDTTVIGLGAGFVGIYVLPLLYQRKAHWWPLIPGSVLLLMGFGFQGSIQFLLENWPLILVLVGVILVVSALLRSRKSNDVNEMP